MTANEWDLGARVEQLETGMIELQQQCIDKLTRNNAVIEKYCELVALLRRDFDLLTQALTKGVDESA